LVLVFTTQLKRAPDIAAARGKLAFHGPVTPGQLLRVSTLLSSHLKAPSTAVSDKPILQQRQQQQQQH
jgi:hypothetical protein